MRIRKVVQTEQEVSIEIGVEDVHNAISEAWAESKEVPEAAAPIRYLLNDVAIILKAIKDPQIAVLSPEVRKIVQGFLSEQAKRYGNQPIAVDEGPHP